MLTLKTLPASALAALMILRTAPAPAAQAPAAPAATPLMSARTISVHEDILMGGSGGKLHPFFSNSVRIIRPNRIKVVVGRASEPGSKPHLYVQDGKTEREYNALTNQYSTVAPAPGGGSRSELRDITQIALILSAGRLPAPHAGVHRVVTSDTLDGRAMVLTTDTPPPHLAADGSMGSYVTKVWIDAGTGLPRRWAVFQDKDGKISPFQEVDFSQWRLNQPIPPAQLAWAPPAGAKPYAEPVLLAVGTPAPDFEVTMSDGKVVHLSDFKGKTVILDFWATWCGPCQASMPHLEKVYRQVKDKDVQVLGLCVWDQQALYDKWVAKNVGTTYTFPVAFDPAGRGPKSIAGSLYKVAGIPTQYVIDKDGKVASASVGYNGEDDHRLEANLRKLGVDISVPQKTATK